MFEQLVLIIHVLVGISIVGLILIQQGKGADMGASFGSGASQTVLGVHGGGNLLTRWTSILATIFFVTSLTLAYFAKQHSLVGVDAIPVVEELSTSPLLDANGAKDAPVITEVSTAADAPKVVPVEANPDEIPAADVIDTPAEVSKDEIPE